MHQKSYIRLCISHATSLIQRQQSQLTCHIDSILNLILKNFRKKGKRRYGHLEIKKSVTVMGTLPVTVVVIVRLGIYRWYIVYA